MTVDDPRTVEQHLLAMTLASLQPDILTSKHNSPLHQPWFNVTITCVHLLIDTPDDIIPNLPSLLPPLLADVSVDVVVVEVAVDEPDSKLSRDMSSLTESRSS